MSAILPQTEIILCHNIPLSKDYANTILFTGTTVNGSWVDGRTMQNNYFKAHTKVRIPNSSYQRVNSRQIKVRGNVQSYEDCNYLMFQNPYISVAGSNPEGTDFIPSNAIKYKWFYAFIDSVDYINNSVSLITYTIDVMQTYLFDWKFKECYVEREHSTVDSITSNTTPENVDCGDTYVYDRFIVTDMRHESDTNESDTEYKKQGSLGAYLLATSIPPALSQNDPTKQPPTIILNDVLNKVYFTSTIGAYTKQNEKQYIDNIIQNYVENGLADNIITLGTAPAFACYSHEYDDENTNVDASKIIDITSLFDTGNTLNGVRVYNKKIFQYPYNLINVTTYNGATGVWKPELFRSDKKCTMVGWLLPTPGCAIMPYNYRFNSNTLNGKINPNSDDTRPIEALQLNYDPDNAIILSDFPVMGWSDDSYKAWIAQNRGTISAIKSNAELALRSAEVSNAMYKTSAGNKVISNMIGDGTSIGSGVIKAPAKYKQSAQQAGLLQASGTIAQGMLGFQGVEAQGIANEFTAVSNYKQTLNTLEGNITDANIRPSSAIAMASGGGFSLAVADRYCFFLYKMTIKPEFIKKVDDYFSRFGYTVKNIKIPNICVRKFFTFVKTIDCNIVPCYEGGFKNADGSLSNVGYGLSANVITEINNIFNNGITIWRYNQEDIPNWVDNKEVYARDTFCNYTLLNSDKYQNTIIPENLRIVNPSDEYVPRTM